MTITAGSSLGSSGNSGNNQASFVHPTTAAITANTQFVIALFSTDNDGSTTGETETPVASVSDTASGSWSKIGSYSNPGSSSPAAQTGVTIQVWLRQPGPALASGQNVTFTLNTSANRDACAVSMRSFNCASGVTISGETLTGTYTQAINAGTLTSGAALNPTSTAIEHLRVRAAGCESNVATNLTPTTNWTAFATGVSGAGTATTEIMALGEYIISSNTQESSDPTHATSGEWASVYVVVKEAVSALTANNLTVGSPTFGTPLLQILIAADLTVGSPVLPTRGISPGIAANLTVSSPAVGAEKNLFSTDQVSVANGWFGNSASIENDVASDPYGGTNADKIKEDSTAATSHYAQSGSVGPFDNQQTSVWVDLKADGRNWAVVYFGFGGGANGKFFGLSGSGTIGGNYGSAPSSAAITALGDGWYRCRVTQDTPGVGNMSVALLPAAGDGVDNYNGDGTSGILVGKVIVARGTSTPFLPALKQVYTLNPLITTIGWSFNDPIELGKATSGKDIVAQTFTGLASLDKFRIFLAKSGSPTDNVLCIIMQTAAGTPTSQIAISNDFVAGSSLATTLGTEYTFTFPGVSLNPANLYAVALIRDDAASDTNFYYVANNDPNDLAPYSGGSSWHHNTGGAWVQHSTGDLVCYLENFIKLDVGSPVLGTPTVQTLISFTATNLTVGSPALPTIKVIYNFVATNLTVGSPSLATPALVQKHVLTATNLTVASPSLPTISVIYNFVATNLTVSSPVFATPKVTYNFVATNLAVGAISLPTPALVQKHVFTATNLTVASPSLPTFGVIYNFTANNLTVGSPVLATPTLVQIYSFTATALTVGSPVFPTPSVIYNFVATNLTVSALGLPTPTLVQKHVLSATNLTVGSPVFGTPVLTIVVPLFATNLTVGSPTFPTPALKQVHVFTATALAVGALGLPTPTLVQKHVLTATALTVGSPVFGTPVMQIVVPLTASNLTVGAPTFPTPAVIYNFTATALAVGSISLPQFRVVYNAVATNLTVGSPAFGTVILKQVHVLPTPLGLTVGSPALPTPALVQKHVLAAQNLPTASPEFGTVVLVQAHKFTATALAVSALGLPTAAIGQNHLLTATNLATASPALPTPTPKEAQAFIADGIAVGAPQIGTAVFVERNAFTTANLIIGRPTFGVPVMIEPLLVVGTVNVSSPVIGAPAVTQDHRPIIFAFATSPIVFGTPLLQEISVINQVDILLRAVVDADVLEAVVAPDEIVLPIGAIVGDADITLIARL